MHVFIYIYAYNYLSTMLCVSDQRAERESRESACRPDGRLHLGEEACLRVRTYLYRVHTTLGMGWIGSVGCGCGLWAAAAAVAVAVMFGSPKFRRSATTCRQIDTNKRLCRDRDRDRDRMMCGCGCIRTDGRVTVEPSPKA